MSGWNLLHRWRERRRQQAVADLQQEIGLSIGRLGDAHSETMQELIPWLEAQLSPLLKQQAQISHERSTWRFVMQMLIASHPNPELLLCNWNANVPNVVDELHDNLPQDDEEWRQLALETWKQELRHFTQLIEHTVQARRAANEGT